MILFHGSLSTLVTAAAFPEPPTTNDVVAAIRKALQKLIYATNSGQASAEPDSQMDCGTQEQKRWHAPVLKGHFLLQQMEAMGTGTGAVSGKPRCISESEFVAFPDDLEKWGYSFTEWDNHYDFDVSVPLRKALEGLGVSSKTKLEGGPNRAYLWDHENEKSIRGTLYRPTRARFLMVINPRDGVILSLSSYAPWHMAQQQVPPVTVLPKLKAYSDITFLQWYGSHGSDNREAAQNIKFVFQTPIENADTKAIITQALFKAGKELRPWPGVTFSMHTDEGKALLGSPNGAGVAFMLIQHQQQLGRKTIARVTVFQDDGAKQPRPPSMVFHVTDAPTHNE
ncbi:hypothetical protein BU26DRAFT_569871 [Trematosphaeria pertusa]|uniref:Uncharacterized protein n=1 Tax=Trematosphaeria pertusa TaxID=390896 RepID=A0A6A6I137_9PLEO|nr:uncharacterized protein BU26DRAFT_569871 [Trematosphaeria pertusa]KAF2243987.1 hypothetical protein BU26DRAFT_569871 [Trematosphaeria pertusa]